MGSIGYCFARSTMGRQSARHTPPADNNLVGGPVLSDAPTSNPNDDAAVSRLFSIALCVSVTPSKRALRVETWFFYSMVRGDRLELAEQQES